jgi:hypothetical protein
MIKIVNVFNIRKEFCFLQLNSFFNLTFFIVQGGNTGLTEDNIRRKKLNNLKYKMQKLKKLSPKKSVISPK